MASDDAGSEHSGFVSHPNTRTLHRGSRDAGAACGQPSPDGWATVQAGDPLEAVLRYATPPCTKCFSHTLRLRRVLMKEHRAQVIDEDLSEIVAHLPWDPDAEYLEVVADA